MTSYFVKVIIGNDDITEEISTTGCKYITHFRAAIKKQFFHILSPYDAAQLKVYEPDGTTLLNPGEEIEILETIKSYSSLNPFIIKILNLLKNGIFQYL